MLYLLQRSKIRIENLIETGMKLGDNWLIKTGIIFVYSHIQCPSSTSSVFSGARALIISEVTNNKNSIVITWNL